ncbi:hypothetical protein BYT27DRAFT_6664277 [Phlegmacium glaucopus]|nr:hypothetical protein BYT27DRAFT_6664277 [Phlegmacium glaucopus]
MSRREHISPILYDPIGVDDDTDQYNWYYDARAGGYILPFNKYQGQKICETDILYLYFCRGVTRNQEFLDAFSRFLDGLKQHAQTNYADFIVPFGQKHRGKTIRQCRDKGWFEWVCTQCQLREKCEVFITAVQLWLANPRHQGVKRDIGELLDASKYEDDLDLKLESDLEFIATSDSELEGGVDRSEHLQRGRKSDSKHVGSALTSRASDPSEESSADASPEPEWERKKSKKKEETTSR